ncbi:glycogen synthase, partial [bacterium]|nr:glycogen synthase [bacterium]
MRDSVKAASAVICVSEAMARVVRPMMPDSDVHVVHNGIDDQLFYLGDDPRDAGILFVGLLVPWKNVDVLIRAYSRIHDTVHVPLT